MNTRNVKHPGLLGFFVRKSICLIAVALCFLLAASSTLVLAQPQNEQAPGNDIQSKEQILPNPDSNVQRINLLTAAGSSSKTFASLTKDTSANASNLVLIVGLTDSPTESFYNKIPAITGGKFLTNYEYLEAQLNAEPSSSFLQSYRSYFKIISKGKFNIKSYFPQEYTDGTISQIRVNMSAAKLENDGTFFNDTELITGAINQLKAIRPDFDTSILDTDNDGFIDNVLIILDLPTNVEITAHASKYAGDLTVGVTGQEKMVRNYTILNGGETIAGISNFSQSVAVHERMHTLGANDYYRKGVSNQNPVGIWDAMAVGGTYAWPLAFTRQQVGWCTVPELNLKTTNKQITLYAPADADDIAGSKPQAFKIKLPSSSSEYFIVEYRKKGRYLQTGEYSANPINTTLLYDRNIGASGLIVYRVNEKFAERGNIAGDDYVYVFRPGETGIRNSAGDLNRAPIAAGTYTTQGSITLKSSIGFLDANKGITDGAICYSNGLNSGLKITATAQTDNSITFNVELAEDTSGGAWNPVVSSNGAAPFATYNSPRTRLITDGSNLYTLAEDVADGSTQWVVYKHDGTNWSKLGSANSSIINVDIAWFNGSLYAIGSIKNQNKTQLKRFNGTTWIDILSIPKGRSYEEPHLAVIGGKLYALISADGEVSVYDCSGSSPIQYGQTLSLSSVANPTLVNVGDNPAVATGVTASKWKTSLYVLKGSTWQEQEFLSGEAASIIRSANIGNKTFVYLYAGSKARLVEIDSAGVVIKTNEISQAKDSASGGYLVSDGTNLYLCAGVTGSGAVVYKIPNGDVAAISQLGNTVYSEKNDLQGVIVKNNFYVAISDYIAQTLVVRSHVVESQTPVTPPTPPTPPTPQIPTVSISFDANGGLIAPNKISGPAGSKITASWPSLNITRSGYNFAGWYTEKADGNGTKVTAYPNEFPDSNVTYYAHWTKQSSGSSSSSGNQGNQSGSSSTGGSSSSSSKPAAEQGQVMYRLYNKNSGEHLFTSDLNEKNTLSKIGWKYEDIAWTSPKTSNTPVYRLYNPNSGDHHYTTDKNEYNTLGKIGWKQEDICWYSDEKNRMPIYRLFNPNVTIGTHHYTKDKNEYDTLSKIGWKPEKVGWYGM